MQFKGNLDKKKEAQHFCGPNQLIFMVPERWMKGGTRAPNVDPDELPGQVGFHNAWQDHDWRFSTLKNACRRAKLVKIQWSKWRDKSKCWNRSNNGRWSNISGWQQQPLNLWYPYMTDEKVWNMASASRHSLVISFHRALLFHKQPLWEAPRPRKALQIFSHPFLSANHGYYDAC